MKIRQNRYRLADLRRRGLAGFSFHREQHRRRRLEPTSFEPEFQVIRIAARRRLCEGGYEWLELLFVWGG
jgi:hypothetical protein